MDTFFEQIIKIKKTGKAYLGYALITLAALILIAAGYLFIADLIIVIAALVVFGAFKLYAMFDVEYEYIITNSSFDIDKIIAKSSRKRLYSFDLSSVERVEKYRKDLPADLLKDAFFACNGSEAEAVLIVIHPEGKAKQSIVIAPNERMVEAIKKFIPKYVGENL